MILLDTHVLLWMVDGDNRLGARARRTIDEAPGVFFSAMSAWELAMLVSRARVTVTMPPAALLRHLEEALQIGEVAVSREIAIDAGAMPPSIHGDPCDRIIMATARALDCRLLTADEKILDYALAGHVKAVDARR